MIKTIHFNKYHGAGNDFVIIDNRKGMVSNISSELIAKICHRRFGVGADGLMLLESSDKYMFTMRYFNSDGGESTMCGNGGRCIAAFAKRLGVAPEGELFEFDAIDGRHYAIINDESVTLKMIDVNGIKEFEDGFFLNTGSPHMVVLKDDVNNVDVFSEGMKIRNEERFKLGGGTNVNFLNIKKTGDIAVRTFERGVEDETWACGTGSVASAMVSNFIDPSVNIYNIEVKGGKLKVSFDVIRKGVFENVWLEGPAVFVFEGDYNV